MGQFHEDVGICNGGSEFLANLIVLNELSAVQALYTIGHDHDLLEILDNLFLVILLDDLLQQLGQPAVHGIFKLRQLGLRQVEIKILRPLLAIEIIVGMGFL